MEKSYYEEFLEAEKKIESLEAELARVNLVLNSKLDERVAKEKQNYLEAAANYEKELSKFTEGSVDNLTVKEKHIMFYMMHNLKNILSKSDFPKLKSVLHEIIKNYE
jgi:hypothetical protein